MRRTAILMALACLGGRTLVVASPFLAQDFEAPVTLTNGGWGGTGANVGFSFQQSATQGTGGSGGLQLTITSLPSSANDNLIWTAGALVPLTRSAAEPIPTSLSDWQVSLDLRTGPQMPQGVFVAATFEVCAHLFDSGGSAWYSFLQAMYIPVGTTYETQVLLPGDRAGTLQPIFEQNWLRIQDAIAQGNPPAFGIDVEIYAYTTADNRSSVLLPHSLYADNLQVSMVPEPTVALSLCALPLSLMLSRRNRQQHSDAASEQQTGQES